MHGWWCARVAIRSNWRRPCRSNCGNWMQGCPRYIQTWSKTLDVALFPSRVATVSLGVLGVMGAMLSITGIFGMAAYSVSKRLRELGIRMALGAQRKEVLQAALGRAFKLLVFGSAAGLASRNSGEPGAGFDRVSGNSARSAGIGWCRSGDGVAGAAGHVDSRATRAVAGSYETAARGVNCTPKIKFLNWRGRRLSFLGWKASLGESGWTISRDSTRRTGVHSFWPAK